MLLPEKLVPFIQMRLAKIGVLELEVDPVGDGKRNRRSDLAILEPAHLAIDSLEKLYDPFLGALLPRFVVEVVSPGNPDSENYRRDYLWKRQQYQNWGIPEYWIVDPHQAQMTVLLLVDDTYQEKTYRGSDLVVSAVFPELRITVNEMLTV